MATIEGAEVSVAVISAAVIVGSTLLCLPRLIRRVASDKEESHMEALNKRYEDEDGIATRESMAEYIVRPQKVVILITACCGLFASTAFGIWVSATPAKTTNHGMAIAWIFAANWACLFIHGIFLYLERACELTFEHCRRVFMLAMTFLVAESAMLLLRPPSGNKTPAFWLPIIQIVSTITVATATILIPRRPDVYFNGQKVDGMRTGCLLSRYTFCWGTAILQKAVDKGHFDEEDLPVLDRARRAERLHQEFYAIRRSPKLYLHIVRVHWNAFMMNWGMTAIGVLATFTPPLILNQLLKYLEKRDRGEGDIRQAWLWVAALGFIKLFETLVLSYVYWLTNMGLLIPIRNQLAAVVFSKTLRKKDIKGTQNADGPVGDEENEDDEHELKDTKQGVINLLSVDSERIATFYALSNIFVESFIGTTLGFIFIIVILGWQSLLAGMVVIVLTTPMNIYFTKKYSKAQDDLMKIRDKKMAVVSEALQGIRQIKFSALEDKWEKKIRDVREEELSILKKVFLADTAVVAVWIINPVFLSAVALSVYAIIHGSISPSVAFSALGIFGELEWTLSIVPEMVTDGFDALVSVKRIQKYLDSAEKSKTVTDSRNVAMVNATFTWSAETDADDVADRFSLRNVNLDFPLGELSIISGRTGSGKSLLLSALLGEADLISGRIEMPPAPSWEERFDSKATPNNWVLPNAVGFVAQIPWIENGTIKGNILSGLPFHERRYRRTIEACALTKDLEMLTDGDMTEIGVNGINLSGGQRWRVSFARAVYSRAGVLILDDIFSAVDAHVGKHIFENGLTGDLMRGRTRILVTHHLKLCISEAVYAVFLSNGTVENAGTVASLQERGILDRIIARAEEGGEEAEEQMIEEDHGLRRTITRESATSRHADHAPIAIPKALQFVQDEERERGAVKWTMYKAYLTSSGGWWVWASIVLFFALQELLSMGRQWWIKSWTSEWARGFTYHTPSLIQYSLQRLAVVASENHTLVYWIGAYTALSFISCLFGTLRYGYVFMASLRASRVLFDDLLNVVLRAPLRWLDTVPEGRILNRFSKDFETVDSRLTNDIVSFLWNSFRVVGINIAAVYLSPYVLLIALVGLAVNIQYSFHYITGAREIKRLESNSRSPIFELFGAALSGVATIRAFGRSQGFIDRMFDKIDVFGQRTWYNSVFNRWVGLRMSFVGTVFAVLIGVVVVLVREIDASMAGFALSFAFNYTGYVIWSLARYADMELDMNSTERILEYTSLPTEDQGGVHPPAAWPTDGRVEVDDLYVSYAPDLPPVLKGITFDVKPRERIGIVGRTGAGKSSLTLALFQFIRATSGTIFIDGVDISTVNLRELRSRLAIIPQDPVLFSGTIRSNLDAFNEYTDADLHEALQRVHVVGSLAADSSSTSGSSAMGGENLNVFASLDSQVSEGGLNLSQGQRQLLCLARAIVARPKLLVLDEATSAVDMETDALIQKSIREEFRDCTTLVIAHRLQTVMDYDRILILGDGKVLEFDSPWKLLQSKGALYDMVQQTGAESEILEDIARKAASEEGDLMRF